MTYVVRILFLLYISLLKARDCCVILLESSAHLKTLRFLMQFHMPILQQVCLSFVLYSKVLEQTIFENLQEIILSQDNEQVALASLYQELSE